jgi:serine/threonine-protein kinase
MTEEPGEGLEASVVRGRKLGRFVLRYQLASGGMGNVYLAQMKGAAGVERWVALKILKQELAGEDRFVRMFLDEARIVSRLNHPNLCGVVDFGKADGRYYLALEYLHGETLSALSRRIRAARAADPAGLRPHEIVARVVADAARGLHAAHEEKGGDGAPLAIVHRDVSPQNIFVLYEGLSKVMDFGIATGRARESRTQTGEFKGKFAYAAPEQLTGRAVDRRTDVFALGIVLWEASLGRRLFRAETEGETVLNVMSKEIPPPSAFDPEIPAAVDRIATRALSREPDGRYATAAQMADELEEWLATLGRPLGSAQISAVMRRLFADRIATREAMLRAGAVPGNVVPEVELDSKSSIATVAPHGQTVRALRKRAWAVPVGVAAVLAIGTGALALWAGGGDPPAPAATAPTATPFAPGPAAPSPTAAPSTAAASTAAPASAEANAEERSPAPMGRLNLMAFPAAEVYLGGRRIGSTPLREKRLPAGRHRLKLVPEGGGAPGFVTVTIRPGKTETASHRFR